MKLSYLPINISPCVRARVRAEAGKFALRVAERLERLGKHHCSRDSEGVALEEMIR